MPDYLAIIYHPRHKSCHKVTSNLQFPLGALQQNSTMAVYENYGSKLIAFWPTINTSTLNPAALTVWHLSGALLTCLRTGCDPQNNRKKKILNYLLGCDWGLKLSSMSTLKVAWLDTNTNDIKFKSTVIFISLPTSCLVQFSQI